MTVLDGLPVHARVAVIRLRSLGDCVLTTPAIAVLHEARPDLEIGVVVEPAFSAVFEGNPAVSRILEPLAATVFRFRPRLCLNLHGGTRSMTLTLASAAAIRAGFAHHKGSSLYSHRIPRAQEILREERPVHTAEHLASAMFFLGVPLQAIPRAQLFAQTNPCPAPYAVIHPVAATSEKTWPAENFKQVAAHLQDHHGLRPVFIAGPAEDLRCFGAFETQAGAPLRETMSLLKGASLFVGNDSGPAHMAAAFGVPTVVLFGPSDPVAWAPWRTSGKVLVNASDIGRIHFQEVITAVHQLKVAQ